MGNVEPACWNPLTRTGSNTVYFTFTYDPDITFRTPDTAQGGKIEDLFDGFTVDQIKEQMEWLKLEWTKGMDGDFMSASDSSFHSKIPAVLKHLGARLAQLEQSSSAVSTQ